MSSTEIITIRLGNCNTYLLRGEHGYILVDAGFKGTAGVFFRVLRRRGIRPEQVKLVVVTHAHYDHVGCLAAIKECCGARVMVRTEEARWLERGAMDIPLGTRAFTRAVVRLGRMFPGPLRFRPVKPDVVLSRDIDLAEYGLEARVLHTPGHSHGSQTVILPSGEAFVGDLVCNYWPLNRGPIFPPFAEDIPAIYKSWQRLLESDVTMIYPAHGKPVPPSRLIEWSKRG